MEPSRDRKTKKEIKIILRVWFGLGLVGCWFGSGPQKEKKEKLRVLLVAVLV